MIREERGNRGVGLQITEETVLRAGGPCLTGHGRHSPASPPSPQLLKALYDEDILTEEAILQWAAEKSLAEEDEKVFLRKVD